MNGRVYARPTQKNYVEHFLEQHMSEYKKPDGWSKYGHNEECIICLCEFKDGKDADTVVILPCGENLSQK